MPRRRTPSSASSGPPRPRSVLVLGAGVAGLVAAREIEARGVSVRVLEATDRVGGRLRTARFDDGAHVELGGELLEGAHAATWRLARALGLERVRVLRRGFHMWTLDGRRDPIPWERLVERLRPASRDFVRAKRSWTSAAARRLARTPVETWMRRERLPHDERAHWRGLVRGLLLGDPRRLSLLQLVSELTGGEEAGPTGDFFRIRGGNDLLPAAIARELASPVVLRAVAHRVRQGPRAVRVEADVDGRPATFDADAAVIALPVPPLRRLAFSPSLPARQRRAIATVGFGPVVKTALRLRSLPAPRGFAFGSDLDVGAFWDASEGVRGSPALVSVTTAGDHAARVSARTERARVAWVANRLPLASPRDVLEGRSVAWEREPFAGGGYAVFDAGFDPRLRAELARPFRRLAFAGEHTSDAFQGYVNGAIESGLRAAAEALRLRG